jgi:ABC-2 type transport system permease protein
MINLVRSEILKIRSTQVWFWMLLTSVALTVLFTLLSVLTISGDTPKDAIDYYGIFTSGAGAWVALLVLGLLALTTEFRQKTITPSLLATPNRWRFLIGKTLAYVAIAIVYGLICLIINVLLALLCLQLKGFPISFGDGVGGGIVKEFVSFVLLAFFGIGLGALVRNQAAAMVIGIVYLFIINPLLAGIPWIRKAYPFEPGGALNAFNSRTSDAGGLSDVPHIHPLVGGLILLVWCVGLLVAGGYLSLNRDIS